MTLKPLPLTAIAACLASHVAAQDAAIDTDGDGLYSFGEVQAVLPEMSEDIFMTLDVSGDGLLDADEIAVATQAGLLPVMEG
jgi:hypothetical protein